jgi:uncharacterized membrane protein
MNTVESPPRKPSVPDGAGVKVEKSITIGLLPPEVYKFWRRFENLPRFLCHLESISETGPKQSRWTVRTPRGKRIHWDVEIIEDRENELISWRSLPGSDVNHAGSVWFTPAPGARGTVVKVSLKYAPPAGKVGVTLAKLWGRDASGEIEEDLFRSKSLLETGEFPTTEGQPRGGKGGRR